VAAFGFRSIPSRPGCAGGDKCAEELFTRLAGRGFSVTAYNRIYSKTDPRPTEYKGIRIVNLKTVNTKGFDTLLHSLKATWHIIRHNNADVVHIRNGGNSMWAVPLRLSGKKVYVSEDGVDWRRDKWPWYGKAYLYLSTFLTARVPNGVIFDNIFAKRSFEERFGREYYFISTGSENPEETLDPSLLSEMGLTPGDYLLFVGRFIPEKGLHYLIPAFEKTETEKKLVLVGGSPNPSGFEAQLRATRDHRVIFPGFVYGTAVRTLMKCAYAYVQPSDIEGLSPVILENMGLGTPVICSDIPENLYAVRDTALSFKHGDIDDLARVLRYALDSPAVLQDNARRARERAEHAFNWEAVADQHARLFTMGTLGDESPAQRQCVGE
jgi:glycosyltransferase involved in cell wall biosynthesis